MNLLYVPTRTVELIEVRLVGIPNFGIFGGCSKIYIIIYFIRTIYKNIERK